MLLKRFRHATLDGALRAVTKELGDDALLIETRRTTAGGYEVLAAPHSERSALQRAHRSARKPARPAPTRSGTTRWTQGFRALAESAIDIGWSDRVLGAVEKALLRTKVHLERPGDPAVPSLSRKVLSALLRTRSLEDPDTRVLAFVGPTGVGKTTTLAKFAARAIRDRGEEVAIVTLDTYRIAAVEQLRAFADMLSCPFEVAFTPNDLRRAVARFLDPDSPQGGVDRVLIDTTGRSPADESALQDLGQVLRACRAETALCIPAHARSRDTRRILESWSLPNAPTAVVLTKDDETEANGEVLATLVEEGVPLSHVTTGQRVPEDIEIADAEALADAAFQTAADAAHAEPERTPSTTTRARGPAPSDRTTAHVEHLA